MVLARDTTGTNSEEERAFLQRRIALFAKVAFLLTAATDVLNLVTVPMSEWFTPGALLDRSMTVVLALMWAVCARGQRSLRLLRTIDAAGFAIIGLAISLMGRFMAPFLAGEFGADGSAPGVGALLDSYSGQMLITGGAILFMFRAAVIPSPPRFTLLVTGVFGLPFAIVPVVLAPAVDGTLVFQAPSAVPGAILDYSIWWIIVTIVCTAASSVIYGLRRDVRTAQKLGQYTLLEKLGEGGMGAVYRARHARLRRPTAIKLLPPQRLSEEAIARFEAEVQLTAELTHPNTITVFDYGRTDDGVFYYAMEYLDGATLAEVVDVDGPQPASRAVRILTQAASALQEAHEKGLVHRDIKPANVMLARQGIDVDAVKVLDFGLVRPVERDDGGELTKDNTVVGTPLYMAPEAIRDARAMGPSGDLYALGAVGYFLLTGTHVFSGNGAVEICAHHLHTVPDPPSLRTDVSIPADLERLILDCLAKSPGDRPADASELVARLEACAPDEAWTNDHATRWWREHHPLLREQRADPEPVAGIQLTVGPRQS